MSNYMYFSVSFSCELTQDSFKELLLMQGLVYLGTRPRPCRLNLREAQSGSQYGDTATPRNADAVDSQEAAAYRGVIRRWSGDYCGPVSASLTLSPRTHHAL